MGRALDDRGPVRYGARAFDWIQKLNVLSGLDPLERRLFKRNADGQRSVRNSIHNVS